MKITNQKKQEQKIKNYNYVLLMAPKKDDYVGQIEAVDNSTHIGKKKVERLINEGYIFIGRVLDCPLTTQRLKAGFAKYERDKADLLDERLRLISKVFKGELDDYKEKATSDGNR